MSLATPKVIQCRLSLPVGPTGTEPSNAAAGSLAYATDTDRVRVKTSIGWLDLDTAAVTLAGDIAAVFAGPGLQGGGVTGTVTLSADFGTTATEVRPGNDAAYTNARTPLPHATSHQDGGTDEVSLQNLSGLATDVQKHEIARAGTLVSTRPQLNFIQGGNLAIVVTDDTANNRANVSFVSAAAHAASHEDGGSDEINLQGLTGQLADPQKHEVAKAAALVSTRKQLNFVDGANVMMTIADNPSNNRTDVTISSTGSGGSNITSIVAGPGVDVTDPNGPTVTIGLLTGTLPGQVAPADSVLLRSANDWDFPEDWIPGYPDYFLTERETGGAKLRTAFGYAFPDSLLRSPLDWFFDEQTNPSPTDKYLIESGVDGSKHVVTGAALEVDNALLRSPNDWNFPILESVGNDDKFLMERASDGAKQVVSKANLFNNIIRDVYAGTGITVNKAGNVVTVAADFSTVATGDNVLLRTPNDWVGFATQAGTPNVADKFLIERASDGAKRLVSFSGAAGGSTVGVGTNQYAVKPVSPDPFDDEFDSGSSDLAERGWTVINWTSGATMTRAGDINPWAAGNAAVPTGQYRSTLVGGQMLIQSLDLLFAYKAVAGSATFVVASDVTRKTFNAAGSAASLALVNSANRTGFMIGYLNDGAMGVDRLTDPNSLAHVFYGYNDAETAVTVMSWDDTGKVANGIVVLRQSGRVVASGTQASYSALTAGRAGLRCQSSTSETGNWCVFNYVRRLPGVNTYPGIP